MKLTFIEKIKYFIEYDLNVFHIVATTMLLELMAISFIFLT
jgi:hypothetical protein